jgi:hypothetical protein
MSLRIPRNFGKFWSRWAPVGFSINVLKSVGFKVADRTAKVGLNLKLLERMSGIWMDKRSAVPLCWNHWSGVPYIWLRNRMYWQLCPYAQCFVKSDWLLFRELHARDDLRAKRSFSLSHKGSYFVRYDIITVVSTKGVDVTRYSLVKIYQTFGETPCLLLHGRRGSSEKNND